MAGFADLFGQAAHQQVSSFDNGGLKNGMVSAGGPAKPFVPKVQGGGPAGFLYNNLVQPFANSTANLTSDISGLVGGAATAVNDVAHGRRGDNMVQSYLKSTPVGQAYQAGGGGGKGLEMAAGNLGSDVLNAATPFLGPEEIAGKVGLKALIGAGLKTGAALGGASGITNAMAAGDTGSQIAGAGVGGLVGGGLVGGALGGAGAVGGKLINRVAQGKAAPAAGAAATKDLVGGNIAKKAQVRGAMDAQNQLAQQTEPFKLPGAREGVSKATAFDKQGNPVSLKPIVNALQYLKMTPETTGQPLENNMQILHDTLVPQMFRHMGNAAEGIKVDASNAMDVGTNSLRGAGLGRFSKNGASGAANDTRHRIETALNGLSPSSTVNEVLGAISNLEGEQARLAPAIAAQNDQAVRQNMVFQDVIDHLDKLLSEDNVDHAIAHYQLSPTEQNALRQDVTSKGGSHELANHIINKINNNASYAEGRSATQPGVIAGQLAKVANVAQAEAPFEAVKPTTGGIGAVPAQLAIGLKHPGYMPFALANLAKAGAAGVQGAVAKRLAPASYEAGLQSVTGPTEATLSKLDISQPQQFENTGTSQISFNGQTPEVPIPVARTEMQTVETPTQLQNQIPLNETPNGATQKPITVNNPLGANLGNGLPETTTTQVPVRRTSAPQPSGKTPILHGLTTPGRVPVEQPPPPPGGGTPPPAASGGFTPSNSLIGALTGLRNVSAQQTGAAIGTPNAPATQPQDQTQQADLTGATGADQTQQQADPYSLQNLQADIARDPKNATTYMDIYKTFHAATAPAKATAAQVASAQAITDGYAALAAANDQIQGFGGTGPQNAPGTLPLVGGFINKNVSAYESTRIDLATALAKALTGRSAVPHSLVNQYMNSIPDATTPPAKAQQMLANLQHQLDLRAQHEAQLNPAAAQLVGASNGQ